MSHLSKISNLNSKSSLELLGSFSRVDPAGAEGLQGLLIILESHPQRGEETQLNSKQKLGLKFIPSLNLRWSHQSSAALSLVGMAHLANVTAQHGVIWRKLPLVANCRHERLF